MTTRDAHWTFPSDSSHDFEESIAPFLDTFPGEFARTGVVPKIGSRRIELILVFQNHQYADFASSSEFMLAEDRRIRREGVEKDESALADRFVQRRESRHSDQ